MAAKIQGRELPDFPKATAIGALGLYISDESVVHFQPMNINFSIIAPLEQRIRKKAEKNLALANRSLAIIDEMVAKGI
jgi:methylenetetrahydrofolate--tRNA-(uracil-5-)-methyltransferase